MNQQLDRPSSLLTKRLFSRPTRWLWIGSALWLAAIIGITLWLRLGSTGLVDETEPLFAEAARQMLVRNDWVTPYFNEVTRFDKPPLVYWLMAIAYQVIGVNEWAARFPSALAATLLAIASFFTLRRFGWPKPANGKEQSEDQGSPLTGAGAATLWWSAWIGSVLVVLNLQTIAWGRIGVSDMLLSGCMGCALLAFFWGYAENDRTIKSRWYLAFYCLSALAVLAKGPVGIVLPGLIVIAFLIYVGNWQTVLKEMRIGRGILLFLAITLPWYILVILANGENYIESFFGYHNVERFTRVVNNHWAPIWYYFAIVPLSFLPWSAYLPIAMARVRFWQVGRWRQQDRSTHLGLFALFWLVIVFGFFTIAATKLPSYTLPLLPAAAILVGLFWSEQMIQPSTSRAVWISHLANIILAIVLAIGIWLSPNWLGNEPEMPQLAETVQQWGVTTWGAGIWATIALVQIVLLLRRQSQWIWSVQLLGFLAFVLMTVLPMMHLVDVQRQLPLRQLAATIVQVQQPGEPVLMIGYRKPSLVFYTQRPITYISAPGDAPDELRKLSRRLSRPKSKVHSLLLIGRPVKLKEAGIKPDQYETIAEAGVHRLGRMEFPPQ